jgi:hypothetical protein
VIDLAHEERESLVAYYHKRLRCAGGSEGGREKKEKTKALERDDKYFNRISPKLVLGYHFKTERTHGQADGRAGEPMCFITYLQLNSSEGRAARR